MDDDRYQPLNRRLRVLVLVLGVGTGLLVMWSVLERPGAPPIPRAAAPAPSKPCGNGAGVNCVGGLAPVFMVPAASAPARPPSR